MINELKGLVGGIQKFSTEDGPGIRTTVFLKGCPLSCKWCHNPELISPGKQLLHSSSKCIGCRACLSVCKAGAIGFEDGAVVIDWTLCTNCLLCTEVCYAEALTTVGQWMTVSEVMAQVLQDRRFYAHTGGGLTISGGELLMQGDFAGALISAAKAEGIHVALDTCGFGDLSQLLQMAKECDLILFDLKLMDPALHLLYTGKTNAEILSALTKLATDPTINPKLHIRVPLIKGVNDSEDFKKALNEFLRQNHLELVSFLPYHDLGKGKYQCIGKYPEEFEAPSVMDL